MVNNTKRCRQEWGSQINKKVNGLKQKTDTSQFDDQNWKLEVRKLLASSCSEKNKTKRMIWYTKPDLIECLTIVYNQF